MYCLSALQAALSEPLSLAEQARARLDQFYELVSPHLCFTCGAPRVVREAEPVKALRSWRSTGLCPRCELICLCWRHRGVSGRSEPPWIVSLAAYHGPLYEHLQGAKGGDRRLTRALARLLCHPPPSLPLSPRSARPSSSLTLVPIPPRLGRLWGSGQSLPHELSRALVALAPQELSLAPRGLRRVTRSPSQASLSREDRLLAQRMSLSASAALRGARVCLVDDVCTTGATLEEARRACLAAGALSVEAFCLMSA